MKAGTSFLIHDLAARSTQRLNASSHALFAGLSSSDKLCLLTSCDVAMRASVRSWCLHVGPCDAHAHVVGVEITVLIVGHA